MSFLKLKTLLEQAPLPFALGMSPGEELQVGAPHPSFVVGGTSEAFVRHIVWQIVDGLATPAGGGEGAQVRVCRLVAVLEGGGEVELQREVIPAEALTDAEVQACACLACGQPFSDRDTIVATDGGACHHYCVGPT